MTYIMRAIFQGGHKIWTEEGFDLGSFLEEEEEEAEAEVEPETSEEEGESAVAMVSAVAEPIRVFIPESPNVQQATRKVLKRRPTQQGTILYSFNFLENITYFGT